MLLSALFLTTGCSASKKNPWLAKRSKPQYVSTSQLGRNKYYFSTGYQKKLKKTFKK
jgi:hypothetical protein